LLLHAGGGLWIREYGSTRQVILNSQLQSLLPLRYYARLAATSQAARLVRSLYRATVRLLPRFDLGCHSLYQLGGPVADKHCQNYHVALLERLAGEYPQEPLFRRLYLRWRRCA
jgi:D-glucuronyl C5-epimerase C-terminus